MVPIFDTICLIGIGLIGSSLAHGIKQHKLANKLLISCPDEDILRRAENLNLGDNYFLSSQEAVKQADLVIIAAPVGAYKEIAQAIAPSLKEKAIVTDVGSTKDQPNKILAQFLPKHISLVPAHPIAGTEYSGPEAGFGTLFQGRWCILTLLEESDAAAVEKVKLFWESLGAKVSFMESSHHDLVLAAVSHLPHLIAYNLVGTASDLEKVTNSEVIAYSASGFRDFTRLASSDPTMWRDICLSNKAAILELLARFSEDLAALQKSIRWEDGEALFALFSRTRKIRQSIIEAGQDVKTPNFGRK